MTDPRKATEQLLSQLQEAASGTLRVSNDNPLLAETHRLRFTMQDERTLVINHKYQDDEPITLPLNEHGTLSPYTLQLLAAVLLVHTTYPMFALKRIYQMASEYVQAAQAGELVVMRIIIVEI